MGISTLMSISDGLDPYILLSKDGKDAVYERRIGQKGGYFPPELAFCSVNNLTVLFPILSLDWRVNNFVSRQGKGMNRRSESTIIIILFVAFWYCARFDIVKCLLLLKPFPLIIEEINILLHIKNEFSRLN